MAAMYHGTKVTADASATADGTTPYRNTALSNTPVAAKAKPGNVYHIHVYNPNTSDVFVQFYDLASGSVTVGTTTPKRTYWVPASSALDDVFISPLAFGTAIVLAATTTMTGGTAPATGLLAMVEYA